MAGHSKWANIQHRKGAQDAKRAKRFAKLVREVIVAARAGQPDPDHNARLRTAIVAAKAQSVPKENIERVLKKAQGGEDDVNFDELRYEGFGPGGIALMVDAMTDNRNRTAAEVRSIFNKHGGALGELSPRAIPVLNTRGKTFAPEDGRHIAVFPRLFLGHFHVIANAWIALKIGVDKFLRLAV